MQMTPVESSNIVAVGYDAPTQELQVQFKNGLTYSYRGVPPSEYQSLIGAHSVGSYFMANIRPHYTGEQI
jgi:hypothetical protein